MSALDESGLAILRDWVTDKIGKKRAIMKTLWTNPSPTASFAAQTVTLSESAANFDFIAVLCSYDTSNTYRELTFIPGSIWVGKSVDVFAHINHIEANRTGGRRVSSSSETSVTFSTGYYNGTAGTSYAIPRVIYGINLNSDILEYNAMTKLWENASPRSDFARFQSVSVNLSDYDGAIIEYSATKDESLQAPIFSRPIAIGDGDKLMGIGTLSNIYGSRYCAVLRDHICFGEPLNHSTSINEAVSVPIAIYGVKGVRKRVIPASELSEVSSYLVKPRDPYGGSLSGFTATKQQNGNAVYTCEWGLGQVGLGFQMVTKGETNSYAMMVSNEPISLSVDQMLYISANVKGYNGNDYFFLIKEADLPSDIFTATRTAANMYALAASGAKLSLVTSSDVFTTKHFVIRRTSSTNVAMTDSITGDGVDFSLSGSFYLAFMIAGSSSPFYGKICVEEAAIV